MPRKRMTRNGGSSQARYRHPVCCHLYQSISLPAPTPGGGPPTPPGGGGPPTPPARGGPLMPPDGGPLATTMAPGFAGMSTGVKACSSNTGFCGFGGLDFLAAAFFAAGGGDDEDVGGEDPPPPAPSSEPPGEGGA